MVQMLARVRFLVGAMMLALVLGLTAPVSGQQPSSVNPTASAVKEDQLLGELAKVSGRCSIPDQKACTLMQPAGQSWRQFHEGTLRWVGGIAVLGMLALLVVFYLTRGMVKIEAGRSGRKVVRFNTVERTVHWLTASCFVVLALSGLNITFGKSLLLPLIGADAFASMSQWGKYAHNYLSFPFSLGVALIFAMWVAGNIPNRVDVEWAKRGGGLVGNDHPPAHRFNAGQKMMYWIVVLGGVASAVTGYLLMFPFYATDIAGMQLAQIVHGVVAVLFIAAMLAHIYIGTIGMEGAFEAMAEGTVDENWARQHHALWLERESARAQDGRAAASPAE